MACISPVNLLRTTGERKYNTIVPCGRCLGCLQKRRAEWTFRIQEENKRSVTAHFITMTYNDEHLPYSYEVYEKAPITGKRMIRQIKTEKPTLNKRHFDLFIKRLRRDYEKGYFTTGGEKKLVPSPRKGAKIKYYAVGEYGTESERPHYHAIIFNLPADPSLLLMQNWLDEKGKPIGFIYIGEVNTASIHYVTKYVINSKQDYTGREKPFSLISSKPAIGYGYIKDNYLREHKNETGKTFNLDGREVNLPRFYRDKLYGISKKKRIAEKASYEYIERENKKFEKFRETGENYFESELINYQQKLNNFKKSNEKNSKL